MSASPITAPAPAADVLPPLAKDKRQPMRLLCVAIAAGSVAAAATIGVGPVQIGAFWVAAALLVFFRLKSLAAQPKDRWVQWWAVALGFATALWIALASFFFLAWDGLSLCDDGFDNASGEDCF